MSRSSLKSVLQCGVKISLGSSVWESKPECKTFVHFIMRPFRTVILSAAKNLTPRPFAALRVTILVYQAYAVFSSVRYAHGKRRAERQTCAQRTLQLSLSLSLSLSLAGGN